jgi:hypothetical protein
MVNTIELTAMDGIEKIVSKIEGEFPKLIECSRRLVDINASSQSLLIIYNKIRANLLKSLNLGEVYFEDYDKRVSLAHNNLREAIKNKYGETI